MEGKQLFEKYTRSRDEYSRKLLTAFMIKGEELYLMLEEAESQGKKIGLSYPIENGPSEPIVVFE